MQKKSLAGLFELVLGLPPSLQPPAKSRPVLAVSGGRDSLLLLHLFDRLRKEKNFPKAAVFHLDHALRKESGEDSVFLQRECQRRGLDFYPLKRPVRVLARRLGRSLEESGRLLRYRLIRRLVHRLQPAYALTAHHADDYLESLMIHLIRGGGPASLATLPLWREMDGIAVFRPFLQISRHEIDTWLKHCGLDFREDPTNQSRDFLRNRLRQDLSPLLYKEGLDPVKLWMNFHNSSASLKNRRKMIEVKREAPLEYIDLDRRLLGMNLPLKVLIDAYLLSLGCSPAKRSFLTELEKQMGEDLSFRVSYSCKQFYLCSDRRGPLWFFRQGAAALQPFQVTLIDEASRKFESRYNHKRQRLILAPNESLCCFQEGMRVALGKGSKKLKKVFQEEGLPLPVRKHIPLIWDHDLRKVRAVLFSFWEGKGDRYF